MNEAPILRPGSATGLRRGRVIEIWITSISGPCASNSGEEHREGHRDGTNLDDEQHGASGSPGDSFLDSRPGDEPETGYRLHTASPMRGKNSRCRKTDARSGLKPGGGYRKRPNVWAHNKHDPGRYLEQPEQTDELCARPIPSPPNASSVKKAPARFRADSVKPRMSPRSGAGTPAARCLLTLGPDAPGDPARPLGWQLARAQERRSSPPR